MTEHDDSRQPYTLTISPSATIKGALVGSLITAFVSWNAGRYNRIGSYLRRWRFIRYFISRKPCEYQVSITQYHYPTLATAANNFYCYAGEPGIGKSIHFEQLVSKQSSRRPSLYVCFKSAGRAATLQNDLSEQLFYGEDGANNGMMSQIMKAVEKIDEINDFPIRFQLQSLLVHLGLVTTYYTLFCSGLDFSVQMVLGGVIGISHAKYTHFMAPLLRQARRQTLPLIVFDDMHKLQMLGMLPDIARYLKLIEKQSVNVMLVSSDEEVWSRLVREPGMKDRLRVRPIIYQPKVTCQRMLKRLIENPKRFRKRLGVHSLFSDAFLEKLLTVLIGTKQMTIRRFVSLLRLVDEQDYERYVELLSQKGEVKLDELVVNFQEILFERETKNMVAMLKIIKRESQALSEEEFMDSLNKLLVKGWLRPDSKVGPLLKTFNITRDLRSDYVMNGTFNRIVLEMAIKEYKRQLDRYAEL